MRCISKHVRFLLILSLLVSLSVSLCGCGQLSYLEPYEDNSGYAAYSPVLGESSGERAQSFASELCVVTTDLLGDGSVNLEESTAAVLFDLKSKEVVYSKNALQQLYPASLTKVMTALVALENGSMDQVLTATDAIKINESNVQLSGLKVGDTMTLYQALRIMLLYSANDVALLIADNIGGSVDHFVEMMNDKAQKIGATNTHFVNPNGLTNEEHYTTAYDLYLILNEAVKYESFLSIISMTSYDTVYNNKSGGEVPISVRNTNGFVNGNVSAPAGVSVIGGKTGTTSAAGHCLMLYAKDSAGNPYIAVVLQSESTDSVYSNMNELLNQIGNS